MTCARFATALLAMLVGTTTLRAQSLGDVAKKTAEERDKAKSAATPTKSYTDKDLKDTSAAPSTKPAPAPPSSTSAEASKTGAKTDQRPDAAKDPVNAEAYWRSRWMPLQKQLVVDLTTSVELDARIDELTNELLGIGPLNARRGGVEAERQRLITESRVLDSTIAADKASIAAIQEEGRRAGALPGWFR
jgi:ribosomal protein L12E/L44/L45/RPP1/RPP2